MNDPIKNENDGLMRDVDALLTYPNNSGLTTIERYKLGEIDNPSGYLMAISRQVIKVRSPRDIWRRNKAVFLSLVKLGAKKIEKNN
tara:strand:+ start:219 stop:476 length:258 start_codon:yes stop_codon:yes gene_type:complete